MKPIPTELRKRILDDIADGMTEIAVAKKMESLPPSSPNSNAVSEKPEILNKKFQRPGQNANSNPIKNS